MTNTRQSGGWGVLAGLVGAACTITNPAFDDDGGALTEGSGGTAGTTGEPPATSGGPGGQDAGETVDGGSEGSDACVDDGDCDDDRFCNGVETCTPGSPEADERGCAPGQEPSRPGTGCVEERFDCVPCEDDDDVDDDGFPSVDCGGTDCDDGDGEINIDADEVCDRAHVDEDCNPETFGGEDADGDLLDTSACCNARDDGLKCGPDCDDSLPGITVPGSDWAHCTACGEDCGALQACQEGACIDARRVFVTSEVYMGDMNGEPTLEGADTRCQGLADTMELGGTFRAFLVDGTVDLAERLQGAQVPYVRLDGMTVAADWQDLIERGVQQPIFIDERRERHDQPFERAWTGLDDILDADCNNWSSTELSFGLAGNVAVNDPSWRGNALAQPCSLVARLYCIEVGGGGG